jgi:hypothetical protein
MALPIDEVYRGYEITWRILGPRSSAVVRPPGSRLVMAKVPVLETSAGKEELRRRVLAAIDADIAKTA